MLRCRSQVAQPTRPPLLSSAPCLTEQGVDLFYFDDEANQIREVEGERLWCAWCGMVLAAVLRHVGPQ